MGREIDKSKNSLRPTASGVMRWQSDGQLGYEPASYLQNQKLAAKAAGQDDRQHFDKP